MAQSGRHAPRFSRIETRSLRNLMARMGHDNERAVPIYKHKSSPADLQIADGLDALLRATETVAPDDGVTTGALAPRVNGPLMAQPP